MSGVFFETHCRQYASDQSHSRSREQTVHTSITKNAHIILAWSAFDWKAILLNICVTSIRKYFVVFSGRLCGRDLERRSYINYYIVDGSVRRSAGWMSRRHASIASFSMRLQQQAPLPGFWLQILINYTAMAWNRRLCTVCAGRRVTAYSCSRWEVLCPYECWQNAPQGRASLCTISRQRFDAPLSP